MNIVTQFPVNLNLNTSNPHTDQARKDALARQLIPQSAESEQSNHEKGLNSDTDKNTARQQPLTYDYIKNQQQQAQAEGNQENNLDQQEQNATDDQENRGKDRQEAQQDEAEQKKIAELKERDQEVKTHEQAHASIGGQHAGAPSYEYEQGPDGKRYAVGGEVSIDVSPVPNDPEATIRKMDQVQRAALAPAEPSAQDRKVAADASSKRQAAQAESLKENAQTDTPQVSTQAATSAAEVFNKTDPETPTRTSRIIKAQDIEKNEINVSKVPIFEAKASLAFGEENSSSSTTSSYTDTMAQSDERITTRALKIQRHYYSNSLPHQNSISATA
ncbi:putative metalloprotease CJM1_0395 family protein [Algibacillus agarilyticus]|uniref:putative metalloprotease CJM1_0395 family protein n=1 Tax=Algibacillus agarilyticus TaxID=2234133 RepID=UPI000DCFA6AF|nr:putative metalloprotease CJM1_0395 family protein [Algibacillus agarilyticus]